MTRLVLGLVILSAACAPSIIEQASPDSPVRAGARRSRFHRFRVKVTAAPAEIRHDLTLADARLPGARAAA